MLPPKSETHHRQNRETRTAQGQQFHCMDKKEPGKEASEAVTRESLIAISYPAPEKDLDTGLSPEDLNGENLDEATNGDGDEKYRSKLISISYTQSPDCKALPVTPTPTPGELKG